MTGKEHHIKPIVQLLCTFCGGEVTLAITVEQEIPEGGESVYCMFHTAPPCKIFIDTDLLDFMIQNRRRLGIPDPEEN